MKNFKLFLLLTFGFVFLFTQNSFADTIVSNFPYIQTIPDAPTNLIAISSNQKTTLTWSAASPGDTIIISPITNYEIYRGTSSGGETLLIEVGNVLTYTDSGLTNGEIYYYKVAAKNAAGHIGPQSLEVISYPIGFRSIKYVLAPTTRTVTNPITRKVETQTIVPKYTCTPYTDVYSGIGFFGPYSFINYGESFETKEDAINATLSSLTNCLNISYPNIVGDSTNYVILGIGGYRPLFFDPARIPYDNNFKAKSICATTPIGGSYFLVSNSNTCTLNSGIYNGISRQVDYLRYMPETVHLRTLFCYNTDISGCSISDDIVPTYKYEGNFNAEIKSINHGFEITWTDLSPIIEMDIKYDIKKSDGLNYYTILNRTIDTTFIDNRLQNPSEIQYYEILAYDSTGLFITSTRIDSSKLPPVKNEISVNLQGSGFNLIENEIKTGNVSVSMTNNQSNPEFIINCEDLTYQDTNTLIANKCEISNAPTGEYDVLLKTNSKTYTLAKPDGFTVSYPEPENIIISNISSVQIDGTINIGPINGDGLFTGSIIGISTVDETIKWPCFILGSYDYDLNQFENDGICDANTVKMALNYVGGDMSKLVIYTSADPRSISSIYINPTFKSSLSDLGVTCTNTSWIWKDGLEPAMVCPGNIATRISNCGEVVTENGLLQCDYENKPRSACINNQCICIPLTKDTACATVGWECANGDLLPDGCGGLIDCGNCSSKCIDIYVGQICPECKSDHKCHW